MCNIDLERCSVFEDRKQRARKEHRCTCCGKGIAPREEYVRHFSVLEGEPTHEKCCLECHAYREEFAKEHGGIPTPGYLEELLEECIYEEPQMAPKWQPMLERIRKTRQG